MVFNIYVFCLKVKYGNDNLYKAYRIHTRIIECSMLNIKYHNLYCTCLLYYYSCDCTYLIIVYAFSVYSGIVNDLTLRTSF